MANFTTELATDIIFPNMSIYRKYCDGVLSSYEVYPNSGYVLYDVSDENYEIINDSMMP